MDLSALRPRPVGPGPNRLPPPYPPLHSLIAVGAAWRRQGRALVGLALVLLGAGCALTSRGGNRETLSPNDGQVALHVTNHHWSDVVVFAVHGSMKLRLGMVVSGDEADFALPRDLMPEGEVSLRLHPLGSQGDYSTFPIAICEGQRIELRVQNHLPQTSWAVY